MSERRLYQELCEACSGSGQTEAAQRKKCRKCEGQGWTLSEDERASLCPDCNGDGDVAHTTTCRKCEGRGFEVRIVDVRYEETSCNKCKGKGFASDECKKCKGTGFQWILRQNFIRPEKVSCSSCAATGKVAMRECESCEGSGRRRVPIETPVNTRKKS
jgi:DnaJ-class molecular chaperone